MGGLFPCVYGVTALHPQAAAPAQVQEAAASPQAQAAAQAEDPLPTSVAADLGEEGEMALLPQCSKISPSRLLRRWT
jgi:hypothetical protein